ncbi:hypothetical protein JET14_13530 [Martelella lutilitoris]|uniref:Uncharacterized protein n=1 Tax=Martelella lutilitoris TaxID=2583532 RepID=A0A7T7KK46_9HYPH|nr:hypothetical protein [Martelella lutilitoris]QQM29345.1 hypothetical protein JET14_13530 [Martelella lutilitoris]
MSGMIERVARAIAGGYWADPPYNRLHTDKKNDRYRYLARIAIEAMREPTPAMIVAGSLAKHSGACDDQYAFVGNVNAEVCWPAMITAALQEGKDDV